MIFNILLSQFLKKYYRKEFWRLAVLMKIFSFWKTLWILNKFRKIDSQGQQQLIQLEDAAKAAGKGKWNTAEAAKHIRNVKWTVENARNFVDSHHNKPIDGKTGFIRNTQPHPLEHGPYYYDIVTEFRNILATSSPISTVIKEGIPNI